MTSRSPLTSPSHAVLAHPAPQEVATFLKPFGFEATATGRLPADVARALYGIDREVEESKLEVPGAAQGWIRVVQTPHPAIERDPFEPRPLAIDLYTRDLDRSIELAVQGGGRPQELVEYQVGPLELREIEIDCPGGWRLVLMELNQRRPSVLDQHDDLLHSEVHSIVWSVPRVQDVLDELCGRAGLEVLADAEIRGDTISRLMSLPKGEVGVRFTLICDHGATPARFEILEFLEDAAPPTAPWLPLRPGLFGPAFHTEDLDAAMARLTSSRFGPTVELDTTVHRKAVAVGGEGPGGFRFELWQERVEP